MVTNVPYVHVASGLIFHFYTEYKDSLLLRYAGAHLQYNKISKCRAPLLFFRIVPNIGLNFTR